jgi:uncharacterized membrane protein
MTKTEIIFGILVGFMLGMFALLILSLATLVNREIALKRALFEIEKETINQAKGICNEAYPVVITKIENGVIKTECRVDK